MDEEGHPLPDTRANILLHYVWTTKNRQPWILSQGREDLHACLVNQTSELGCRAIATGGTDDHVHMLVAMQTDVTPARLVQQAKGVSSLFCKDCLNWRGFYWQDGYGVFSVSPSHTARVAEYIRHQMEHHASGKLWSACEPAPE